MRKFISLFVVLLTVMALSVNAFAYTTNIRESGASIGDINGDGSTNNKDITVLFRMVSENNASGEASDVNRDGYINNKDITLLFRYISDLDIELPDDPVTEEARITNSNIDSKAINGNTLTVTGWFGANYGVKNMNYTINGGSKLTDGITYSKDAELDEFSYSENSYRFSITADVSSYATNMITVNIFAKLTNGTLLSVLVNGSGVAYTVSLERESTGSDVYCANRLVEEYGKVGNYWSIYGWAVYNGEITNVAYRLDGGEPVVVLSSLGTGTGAITADVTTAYRDADLEDAVKNGGMANGVAFDVLRAYRIKVVINASTLSTGDHTVEILTSNGSAWLSPFEKTYSVSASAPAPAANVTNSLIDESSFYTNGKVYVKGWYGANYATAAIGYSVNGGAPVFANVTFTKDSALDAHTYSANSYRFEANFTLSNYTANTVSVNIFAKLANGETVSVLKNASGSYTVDITQTAAPTVTDRQRLINQAVSWLGCNEADGSHKQIIDVYNADLPLPVGYTVKYTDAWCATFVSACAIKTGLTDVVYKECGAHRQMELFANAGRFQGRNYVPAPGDIIFYDWDAKDGHCDHVGIVTAVSGTTITVIEGNKSDAVGYRTISVGAIDIYGYGVPAYKN